MKKKIAAGSAVLMHKKKMLSPKERKAVYAGTVTMFVLVICFIAVCPYADGYGDKVLKAANQVVNIIAFLLRTAGVILSAYATGQLVLSFKNEDADSKTRAATQLVVGIILIVMPTIMESFDLAGKIKS